MGDIAKKLRASVGIDAINGDSFERFVCGSQMLQAADEIVRLQSENNALRKQVAVLENVCFHNHPDRARPIIEDDEI